MCKPTVHAYPTLLASTKGDARHQNVIVTLNIFQVLKTIFKRCYCLSLIQENYEMVFKLYFELWQYLMKCTNDDIVVRDSDMVCWTKNSKIDMIEMIDT